MSQLKKKSKKQTKYENNVVDSVYWFLNLKRPFIINNEYKIDLQYIDDKNRSAKIVVTKIVEEE